MDRSSDIPDSILTEAAEWLTTLAGADPSEKDRRALAAWLTRSPMHIEALLSASTLKAQFADELKAHPEWFPDVLADLALDANVVPLIQQGDVHEEPGKTMSRPTKTIALLAASLVVVVTSLSLFFALDIGVLQGSQSYTTELGEQRSLVLDDGSVIELNTQSVLRVEFDAAHRNVELISGEAIFDVVKDAARPFRVLSGDVTVEAIGTRFNVYRQAERTVVTVVEGRVAVSPINVIDWAADELAAGEQLIVARAGTVGQAQPVDIEVATAWTQRRIALSANTLEEAAQEFNRYNRAQLLIDDPLLRERRITGVFNANDPDAFVTFVESYAPVRVIHRPDGSREIRTREK